MKSNIKERQYFESIKDDENYSNISEVLNSSNKKIKELYELLMHNNSSMYAGGSVDELDNRKINNVLIDLYVKAIKNNKKYTPLRFR